VFQEDTMTETMRHEKAPGPPWPRVIGSVARSMTVTIGLLLGGRIRSPRGKVGAVLTLPGGTRSAVFRETQVDGARRGPPAVLIVEFRLRLMGSRRFLHALFRTGCVLNTPLFAGFPGFRTKLWMADVGTGGYRGLYEWDGATLAEAYAAALVRILRPLSVRASVRSTVIPDLPLDAYVDALPAAVRRADAASA
jgi:hypothetical protein